MGISIGFWLITEGSDILILSGGNQSVSAIFDGLPYLHNPGDSPDSLSSKLPQRMYFGLPRCLRSLSFWFSVDFLKSYPRRVVTISLGKTKVKWVLRESVTFIPHRLWIG